MMRDPCGIPLQRAQRGHPMTTSLDTVNLTPPVALLDKRGPYPF